MCGLRGSDVEILETEHIWLKRSKKIVEYCVDFLIIKQASKQASK